MRTSISSLVGIFGARDKFCTVLSGRGKIFVRRFVLGVALLIMAWKFFPASEEPRSSEAIEKNHPARGGNKKRKKLDRKRKASSEIGGGLAGRYRGIEGSKNSCYLDAFLFSVFYATTSFDQIFCPLEHDTEIAAKIKNVLKNNVVSPLRENLFCPSSETMKLRNLLKKQNPKIMGSFQAIEDVLYLLFENVLNISPFIQYEDGASGYMHVILVDESSPRNSVVNIQGCFADSMMLYGGLKFKSVPTPAFILSLPWHKNRLFHLKSIVPSLLLKIEENITKCECNICKKNAVWESNCQPAAGSMDENKFLCNDCIPENSKEMVFVNRTEMMLTSVMCFRGAHFTAIVQNRNPKYEVGRWYFFDSMAGGTAEVTDITEPLLNFYDQWEETASNFPNLPWNVKAFFEDAHTCIYEPIIYEHEM